MHGDRQTFRSQSSLRPQLLIFHKGISHLENFKTVSQSFLSAEKMDNKTLTARLSKSLSLETSEVTTLIEALSRVFKESCGDLDSVAFPGFGTFKAEKTDEYIETDGVTGRKMLYPPKINVVFQPSIIMRKKLSK